MRSLFRLALFAMLASPPAAAIAAGCGSTDDTTSGSGAASTHSTSGSSQSTASAATSSGGAGGAGGVSGTGVGGGTGPGGDCTPGATECTDCIDNDGDGWIDSWDINCIGPLDDDETNFATGIPGDNKDPCKQDCFFDGNSGSGDDGCLWDLACDPNNPGADSGCPYDPAKMNCPPPPSQECLDNCAALTPNGCDCFGCCEITLPNMSTVTVLIEFGCTADKLADPTVCKPCAQQQGCLNPCDPCEYCLGKTVLPPECGSDGGGGGTNGCASDEQPCAPEFPCPANFYCLTGCCIQIPS